MAATDDLDEFPMEEGELDNSQVTSDEENSEVSDEDDEIVFEARGCNNNATQSARSRSCTPQADRDFEQSKDSTGKDTTGQSNARATSSTKENANQANSYLQQAFHLMQYFMLHKGLITSNSLNEDDLGEFLEGASSWRDHSKWLNDASTKQGQGRATKQGKGKSSKGNNRGKEGGSVSSVTTVYKRAIQQINDEHSKVNKNNSLSSDELIDTSDEFIKKSNEMEDFNLTERFIAGCAMDRHE